MPSIYLGRGRELENELLANKAQYLCFSDIVGWKHGSGIQAKVLNVFHKFCVNRLSGGPDQTVSCVKC